MLRKTPQCFPYGLLSKATIALESKPSGNHEGFERIMNGSCCEKNLIAFPYGLRLKAKIALESEPSGNHEGCERIMNGSCCEKNLSVPPMVCSQRLH